MITKNMKKGQASIELLFVIGFAMLLIIPSLALFGRFVQETTYTATASQTNKIGNQMLTTALQAFHNGDGTVIVIEVNMPDGIQEMEINTDENAIIFTLNLEGEDSEQVYFSTVPIDGTFEETDYNKGIKKFKFEVNDSTVKITRFTRGATE
jgi:hypothetical protein